MTIDVSHKTIAEVKLTIRSQLNLVEQFLKSPATPATRHLSDMASGEARAYRNVLGWLSDLEK